jgi:hypothetical protein
MPTQNGFTTTDILEAFSEEIAFEQGTVKDVFNRGSRLIARAVLPKTHDLPGLDRHHAGVAIKVSSQELCLHPYVFRVVCSNGAIVPQAVGSQDLSDFFFLAPDLAMTELRCAIRACCRKEVFMGAMGQMRSAQDIAADPLISLLPMLKVFSEKTRGKYFDEILDRFFIARDTSQFGLMNAVTSVARDTRDAEARWKLEELGGAIAISAGSIKPRPKRSGGARRKREAMAV